MTRTTVGVWLVLLGAWMIQTHQYVKVWRSDLTLWRYAVAQAPQKPRPAVNYGLALLRAGQLPEAARAFRLAHRLTYAPHVTAWDRVDTLAAIEHNLDVIAVLSAQARP